MLFFDSLRKFSIRRFLRLGIRRQGGRRGFTVLELLVCLGIIALLLSLLLPAMTRAHRAALRTQCRNNLKEINLALGIYHDLYETFPPGYVSRDVLPTDGADQETGPGYAWGCLVLGFLEQKMLLQSIDFDLDATDPALYSIAGTVLSPWRCPVSATDPVIEVDPGWGPMFLGASSYVGMYGFGSLRAEPGAPPGPGILYRNSHVPIKRIRDGCSNTMIIGERAGRFLVNESQPPVEAGATWFAAVPGGFRPAGIADHPDYWEGPASLVLASVGQERPFPLESRPNGTTHIGGLSSSHRGGFHAGMADSSGRFINDRIDRDTLRRLAQHSDGRPAGEF